MWENIKYEWLEKKMRKRGEAGGTGGGGVSVETVSEGRFCEIRRAQPNLHFFEQLYCYGSPVAARSKFEFY